MPHLKHNLIQNWIEMVQYSCSILIYWIFCVLFLPIPSYSEIRVSVLGLVAYGAENIIPAFDIAVAESNDIYAGYVTFNLTIIGKWNKGDYCDDYKTAIVDALSKFYYREVPEKSYLLIVPTGCSAAISFTADLSREWNVPAIASGGSDSNLRNKTRFPTLVCIVPSKADEFAVTFAELLRWYKWHKVNFICDADYRTGMAACSDFQHTLKRQKEHYDVYEFTVMLKSEANRSAALISAHAHAKVTVILSDMDVVRLTLVTAARLKMTTRNYVYITYILHYNTNIQRLDGSPQWFRNDSLDATAKSAFQSLLILTMPSFKITPSLNRFLQKVDRLSAEDNFTYESSAATIYADDSKLYAVYTYATFRSAAQVINETIAEEGLLKNGADFAHRMYNRSFTWLDQEPFYVSERGDRDGVYAVLAYSSDTERMEETLLYDASLRVMSYAPSGLVWIRTGQADPESLECDSFDETSRCQVSSQAKLFMEILIPTFVIFIFAMASVVYVYYWNYETSWTECPFNLTECHLARLLKPNQVPRCTEPKETAGRKVQNG